MSDTLLGVTVQLMVVAVRWLNCAGREGTHAGSLGGW